MYKEKNALQTSVSAGEYLAPSVKVVEIKNRKVICGSGNGSTEDSVEGNTDPWFKS